MRPTELESDLLADLVLGADQVMFAEHRLKFFPDQWQGRLLRSTSRQLLLNVTRQGGKSTVTAVLALHTALREPGSLILLGSPSQRQSRELFIKVMGFLKSLEPAEALDEDNRLSVTLKNGSRIVSLPGDAKTVRGFSAPSLVIEDEAAQVPDELYVAIRPMLATSGGRLILMSTPFGKLGHFYEAWTEGEGWERIKISGSECSRIPRSFLDAELKAMGPMLFSQEYQNEFIDEETGAFMTDLVAAALVEGFEEAFP
jgi:hypothetical protein